MIYVLHLSQVLHKVKYNMIIENKVLFD